MTRLLSLAGLLLLGASLSLSAQNMPQANPSSANVSTQATDQALQQEIQQRLRQDSNLNLVKVRVQNREVTLQGAVPSNADRETAYAVANAVPGTAKVHNRTVTTLDSAHPTSPAGPPPDSGRQKKIERK